MELRGLTINDRHGHSRTFLLYQDISLVWKSENVSSSLLAIIHLTDNLHHGLVVNCDSDIRVVGQTVEVVCLCDGAVRTGQLLTDSAAGSERRRCVHTALYGSTLTHLLLSGHHPHLSLGDIHQWTDYPHPTLALSPLRPMQADIRVSCLCRRSNIAPDGLASQHPHSPQHMLM